MRKNEFLFNGSTSCTSFRAVFGKLHSVLVLIALRFDAKYIAFWY